MRDTCSRLWCHFKALPLRKWANKIPIGESLPGSVDPVSSFWRSNGTFQDNAFTPGGWGGGWGVCRSGEVWRVTLEVIFGLSRSVMASFFSCYASKKMAAFELHSSYRSGWSSSTLALGCQRLTGLSWWASIIRGCRTQDTHWHICWHRVHKQGPVEEWMCGCVCFYRGRGVILIGLAYELTGIKEPTEAWCIWTRENSFFSCLWFKTLPTK